jgi:hypothetical protein
MDVGIARPKHRRTRSQVEGIRKFKTQIKIKFQVSNSSQSQTEKCHSPGPQWIGIKPGYAKEERGEERNKKSSNGKERETRKS